MLFIFFCQTWHLSFSFFLFFFISYRLSHRMMFEWIFCLCLLKCAMHSAPCTLMGGRPGVTILIPDFPFIRTRHCRLSNGDARVKMSGERIVRMESLNIRISKTNHQITSTVCTTFLFLILEAFFKHLYPFGKKQIQDLGHSLINIIDNIALLHYCIIALLHYCIIALCLLPV